MHNIVFLDRSTFAPGIRFRDPAFPHTLKVHERTAPTEVAERLADATIAINNKVELGAATLANLPKLKLIAVGATGTDVIDKAYCQAHAIVVSNIRGYAQSTVPEHSFALLLALSRNIIPYRADVLAGVWQRSGQFCFFDHPIMDLGGKRLGIFGKGNLGQRMAAIARGFEMEPVFAARKGETSPGPGTLAFDEVLETSDALTLHLPLTAATRGMIAMPEFRRMKRRPILVNTARGGIVDEADLEAALEQGLVRAAGIDVTSPEPPPADSVVMRLARRDNVILTPHVAWASDEAQQAVADQVIDNIEAFVAGRPTNVVGE